MLGYEGGPAVPAMKADDYDNWISESSGCHTSDVLDYYISDMNVSVLNGIRGLDDILNDNLFVNSGYVGQNLMLDMTEESMKLPALKEKAEMVDMNSAGSCQELTKNSDYSQSFLVSHYDQEVDVNSGNVDLDEVDFDPQLFIRNFLDLSDVDPDLLPALVPKETERKRVTLVLDLDGKKRIACLLFHPRFKGILIFTYVILIGLFTSQCWSLLTIFQCHDNEFC